MRKRTWLWMGVAGVVAGLAGACSGTFVCTDDSNCDLSQNGRCVDGACDYSPVGSTSTASGDPTTATTTAPTSGATVATTTDATTGQPSTSSGDPTTATATDATTGDPIGCKKWEVLSGPGKATGVALLADGGVIVVGVRDAVQPEVPQVLAKRLDADGSEMMWMNSNSSIASTADEGLLQDIDVVARVFQPDPDSGEVLVAFSIREGGDVKNKIGPYLARVAVDDGTVLSHDDALAAMDRSLRGAVMPDPDTMLFAGHESNNKVWYDRADFPDGVPTETWMDPIQPLDPNSGMMNPERAQAIVALSEAAVVGGTREPQDINPAMFRAWLRSVNYESGTPLCGTCFFDNNAGVLALAPTSDGNLFVGGFVQPAAKDGGAELWLARVSAACPLACDPPVWEKTYPGSVPFNPRVDDYKYAEHVSNAVHALHPHPGGGVVAGGTLDNKPWLARYSDDGELKGKMYPSAMAEFGAVLAIAVSDDDGCVTVAGSENYLKGINMRNWWIRRFPLE